jgi:hypothetical protein
MAQGPVTGETGEGTVFDIKISWTHAASRQQTGFSLRPLGPFVGTPLDVATNVDTALRTPFRGLLNNTDSYLGVDAVNVTTKVGGSISPSGIVGASAGAMGPGFLAAVLSLKGEQRTRQGQGRMFLPVYFEGQVDFETLTPTGQTDLGAFVEALRTNYIETGVGDVFKMVNWHPLLPADRPHKGTGSLPVIPSTWYDVTSVRLNPQVTSLRSRKQGVGS